MCDTLRIEELQKVLEAKAKTSEDILAVVSNPLCPKWKMKTKWVSVGDLRYAFAAVEAREQALRELSFAKLKEVEAAIWATCEEGSLGREKMRELKEIWGVEE